MRPRCITGMHLGLLLVDLVHEAVAAHVHTAEILGSVVGGAFRAWVSVSRPAEAKT
jgi:hypothetical protein